MKATIAWSASELTNLGHGMQLRSSTRVLGGRRGAGRWSHAKYTVHQAEPEDQREIAVLNDPTSFERERGKLAGVAIQRDVRPGEQVDFALLFATRKTEVDSFARLLAKAAHGDAIVWVAYPKGTSKRYTCEYQPRYRLGRPWWPGLKAARQVAIDDDGSALRFRRAGFIKSLKRATQRAMSLERKKEVAEQARGRRPTRG